MQDHLRPRLKQANRGSEYHRTECTNPPSVGSARILVSSSLLNSHGSAGNPWKQINDLISILGLFARC